MSQKPTVLFFAWQTDSPWKTNRLAIKMALQDAIAAIEEELQGIGMTFDLQEAMREDDPGSPGIAATLLAKIERSDIFVADVSIINPASPVPVNKTSNGNVMFEAGHAIAHLGEERTVFVFNECSGAIETDLPFDIRHQRISRYRMTEAEAGKKQPAQAQLNSLMRAALKAIIAKDPKRPAELKGKSEAQIKRERDIENARWLLGTIHWPSIDQHLEVAPRKRLGSTEDFLVWFQSVMGDSHFHIYDQELMRRLEAFRDHWNFSYYGHQGYYSGPTGAHYEFFQMPGDVIRTEEQGRAWKEMNEAVRKMREAKDDLLKYIREHYVEIDIKQTSKSAWKAVQQMHAEVEQSLADKPVRQSKRRSPRSSKR
jgi:hypothetical protein